MDFFTKKSSGSSKAAIKEQFKPWVEKYRPRTTTAVAHQKEVVAVLRKCIEGGDMPHLLFYGPPGTGKTSTILAVARDMFGPELIKDRVLELNASDERGIQVVREQIKNFASVTAHSKGSKEYPCPPFKIIILDEADAMTSSAQSALRRTIEQHSKVTRFCLICNYISRIIEPLASRCAKFRFKPLSDSTLLERLQLIRDSEKVDCSDDVLKHIVSVSGGDMRQGITFLQSAYRLRGDQPIEKSHITDIAGTIPDEVITKLLAIAQGEQFDKLETAVADMMAEGYPATQLLAQLHNKVLDADSISDEVKSHILLKASDVDRRLVDGADEHLQVLDFCSSIMQACHH